MIPAWLALSALRKLPWRLIAGGVLLAGLILWAIWYRHSLIADGKAQGRAEIRLLWESAEKAATDAHNARLKEINDAHHKSEVELQARLQSALDRPATRTIRVPVGATCPRPAASPGDAGLPAAGDPPAGFVDVVDTGYPAFRDWLIHYAAGPSAGGGTDAAVPD